MPYHSEHRWGRACCGIRQRLEDAAVGCLRPCRRLSSGASPSRFWQRRFQLLITSSTDAQDYSYPCSHALQTRNCQLDTDGFAQHSPITVGKHIFLPQRYRPDCWPNDHSAQITDQVIVVHAGPTPTIVMFPPH
jgi:hypothetical protein